MRSVYDLPKVPRRARVKSTIPAFAFILAAASLAHAGPGVRESASASEPIGVGAAVAPAVANSQVFSAALSAIFNLPATQTSAPAPALAAVLATMRASNADVRAARPIEAVIQGESERLNGAFASDSARDLRNLAVVSALLPFVSDREVQGKIRSDYDAVYERLSERDRRNMKEIADRLGLGPVEDAVLDAGSYEPRAAAGGLTAAVPGLARASSSVPPPTPAAARSKGAGSAAAAGMRIVAKVGPWLLPFAGLAVYAYSSALFGGLAIAFFVGALVVAGWVAHKPKNPWEALAHAGAAVGKFAAWAVAGSAIAELVHYFAGVPIPASIASAMAVTGFAAMSHRVFGKDLGQELMKVFRGILTGVIKLGVVFGGFALVAPVMLSLLSKPNGLAPFDVAGAAALTIAYATLVLGAVFYRPEPKT
jgi:hypothetical protein